MAKSIDDSFDDFPLDDVFTEIKKDLEKARKLQSQGAILDGKRPIDVKYTEL